MRNKAGFLAMLGGVPLTLFLLAPWATWLWNAFAILLMGAYILLALAVAATAVYLAIRRLTR